MLTKEKVKLVFGDVDEFLLGSRRRNAKGVPVRVGSGNDAGLQKTEIISKCLSTTGKKAHHQRSGALGVDGLRPGHGTGTHGSAVVSALEDNHVLLAGSLPGELDGGLNSLGTRVPEEELVKRGVGHNREKLLNEFKIGLVESDGALEVNEVVDLFSSSLGDRGVAAKGAS